MWIFYSTLIFQENTAEAKISAKTISDQPTSKNEVATENQRRGRKLSFQSFPSHDITKISIGEEIEDCSKRSRDLKIKLATRMTKATNERSRDNTLMLRRQLNITEVATSV